MWNTPLISGTGLSIATGCALVLLGLSLGLLVAGLCLAFVAASGDRQASSPEESDGSISDDEIELVIELMRDAVAGSGWTLCGDCYTRTLLRQVQHSEPEQPCSGRQEPQVTARERAQPTRDRERYPPGRSWVPAGRAILVETPENGEQQQHGYPFPSQRVPAGHGTRPSGWVRIETRPDIT